MIEAQRAKPEELQEPVKEELTKSRQRSIQRITQQTEVDQHELIRKNALKTNVEVTHNSGNYSPRNLTRYYSYPDG
jgi:hypothetical protein